MNPQPTLPSASGTSVRWLSAGLTVVTVASTGMASSLPPPSSSSVDHVEMCNEQCAPTNSTTPATPEAIGRVSAIAVTSAGTHGACTGAGPGPAAKSNTGAATRNALSGIVEVVAEVVGELGGEVGAELDAGADTPDSRSAVAPERRASDAHAASATSTASSATSLVFTTLRRRAADTGSTEPVCTRERHMDQSRRDKEHRWSADAVRD